MKKFLVAFLLSLVSLHGAEPKEEPVPPKVEQTLSIIKPDAVQRDLIGPIITIFEQGGLHVVAGQMLELSPERAQLFYQEHKERTFFKDLVTYMTTGPIFVMVLEGPDAVAKNRELMGSTNPKEAKPGTIRALYGTDVQRNAVHGSDSQKSAEREIAFFFSSRQIFGRK